MENGHFEEQNRFLPEDWTEEERERFFLASARISAIPGENCVPALYIPYFENEAAFLLQMVQLAGSLAEDAYRDASLEELQALNLKLYGEILPENYDACFGNPAVCVRTFGRETGQLLCFLYAELRGAVVFAYEGRWGDLLILLELFLEVYCLFTDPEMPDSRELRGVLCSYVRDYCPETAAARVRESVDPSYSFFRDILLSADLSDPRYLYRFGEYITDSEIETARFLASLPQEEIDAMARVMTEGYRIGFELAGKDLSKKKTAGLRYRLGFERVAKSAVMQFSAMGLECVIQRSAVRAADRRQHLRIGTYGAVPNPQFEYDHRGDAAIWLDDSFVTLRLQSLQQGYEGCRELAAAYAGPAVMEVFGEKPFAPADTEEACRLSDAQQAAQARLTGRAAEITNRYIPGDERSFTIIAWPVPGIGPEFSQIFRETVKINTLDYRLYRRIQQTMIDTLDQAVCVRVRGMNGNRTDLTIRLCTLTDPAGQTIFENCVADVNIPVGEVFTSPVLKGTDGVLHVSCVYLEGLQFRDLMITLKDGMVTDYSCGNFDDPDAGRRLVEENILFHHPTLPIGEFAIGTNTTAYRAGKRFGIADRLPILIAEKTGPHFAFGDTCYSYQEDMPVYNPDGKEIIARDNECSRLRGSDPEKAYFGCHTDITLPYEELGLLAAVRKDGTEIPILREGRFVLPGTEELNLPLDSL